MLFLLGFLSILYFNFNYSSFQKNILYLFDDYELSADNQTINDPFLEKLIKYRQASSLNANVNCVYEVPNGPSKDSFMFFFLSLTSWSFELINTQNLFMFMIDIEAKAYPELFY